MKLAECLNSADIMTLRKVAEHYQFSCSRHSKMELIQEILYHFRSQSFLAENVPQWGQTASSALLRLAMDPRKSFSAEEIPAMFGCTIDDPPLQSALAEGWLFANTHVNGRFMFFIPDELRTVLRDAAVDRHSVGLVTDVDGPLVFQDEAHAMARDLDVFLEYVSHHDVRLTVDGAMYKRNLTQVLQLLEVPEEPPSDSWRFGYGRRFHEYPDRLALLYDFAYQSQLLRETDDGWLVTGNKVSEWLSMGPFERARQLLKCYISVYRRPILRLPLIIQLLCAVSPDWIRTDTMLSMLGDLVKDYYYDSREQVWNVRVLKMLTHLGVIRIGQDEASHTWFQITKLGQQLITPDDVEEHENQREMASRILIVQPNFDIVVTADQPVITAELANIADLTQAGMVRVYRMSEESVKRGLLGGKSGDDWVNFLARHTQATLPGNVERMIREWTKPPLTEIASAEQA